MEYLIHILILIAIYAILAFSVDMLVGMLGYLALSVSAFYGLGAYSFAILTVKAGLPMLAASIGTLLIAIIFALIIGKILLKLRGDYFALASMGVSVIFVNLFLNLRSITGGALGIPGIARPYILGLDLSNSLYFLIFSSLIALIVFFVYYYIDTSSFGRVAKSIREDIYITSIFGYKVKSFMLILFIISGIIASVAGILYASYISFIDPNSFSLAIAISLLTAVILGGLSSSRGAFFGVLFLILLPEFLRFIGFSDDIAANMRQIIYGLGLVLVMMYQPRGIFGRYKP